MKKLSNATVLYLGGIVLLGMVLRILYLFDIARLPFFEYPVGDAKLYFDRALEILNGHIVSKETFFHSSPAYPYFIAVTYWLAGKSLAGTRIVQMLMGLGSILVIYAIGKRVFGRVTGLVAAFLMSVYPLFIYFEGDLMMIPVVLFTLSLSCLFALMYQDTRKVRYMIFTGIMLGLNALGKPDTIMLAPFVALWLFFTDTLRRRAVIHFFALVFSVCIVIFPFTIMNYLREKEFILLTSNGGVNLYIGNHAGADGMFHLPADSGLWDHRLFLSSKEVAERELGRRLSSSEVSRFWAGKAMDFMRTDPAGFIRLLGKKVLLIINRFEVSNHHNYYFFRKMSLSLRANPLQLVFLVFFAVMGFYYAVRDMRKNRNICIPFGYFCVTFMVTAMFFVTSRYRLPTVLFMLLFASFGLVKAWETIQEKAWVRAGIIYAVALTACVLSCIRFPEFGMSFNQEYNNMGNIYYEQGEYTKALACYQRTLKNNPYAIFAHYNIGNVYRKQGKSDLALSEYIREIEINPMFAGGYKAVAEMYLEKNNVKKAQEYLEQLAAKVYDREGMINLAYIYSIQDQNDKAIQIYEELNTKYPKDPLILHNLFKLYKTKKDSLQK
ncbi:MAG: tetratricopeptide repeat protein [Candidatus Auribacter fodinae]|jgi:4-amino-4-deoxy-L-arabinose transferase-like glycosyltransferase|uniref:Tetratricopeptide repeat protein n=1 Tax=Candidatus Auribacter fodinae TaxID=2093366 RepID=A0A3A4R362_9BACT|nr:MAG: tetratricopeptide repeat protein [Candidatus Auribacter fodinae]